jgi:branched-chain amino acid transport system ATP-binding protein
VHSGSIGFRGQEIGGQTAFSIVRKGPRCRQAGGCSCSKASRTICFLAPQTLRDRRAPRHCSIESTKFFQNWRSGAAARGHASGGERQMLRRPCPDDPKLLMLDEPSLGLAPAVVGRRTRPSAGCTGKG